MSIHLSYKKMLKGMVLSGAMVGLLMSSVMAASPANELAVYSADIAHFPTKIHRLTPSTNITIGDLHGNALKLLFFLVSNDIVKLTPRDYEQFAHLYKKSPKKLDQDDVDNFDDWLSRLVITPNNKLIFLGDDVCDRGMNDYFTLKMFERLDVAGVDFSIVLSNHGNFFLKAYERPEQSFAYNPYGPGKHEKTVQSMLNMQVLIEKNLVNKKDLLNLIQSHYLSHIKFPAYVINQRDKEITLYSHAPIDLNMLKNLATDLGLSFQDDSLAQLTSSLDAINATISQWVMSNTMSTHYENINEKHKRSDTLSPLKQVLWNRDYTLLSRDNKPQNKPYKVNYVHGHDSQKNVFDLDNQFGKGADNDYGPFAIVFSRSFNT